MTPRLFLLLLLPLLSHCASVSFRWQECAAHPTPLPTALWPQSLQSLQQLRKAPQGPVLAAVRRDEQSLSMQVLDPLGVELFRLDWRDGRLNSSGPGSRLEGFDMRVLVADFQLVHWPLPVLQHAWHESAWRVQQNGSLRQLSCAGVAVSEVRYPQGDDPSAAIVLSNHLAGYTLEILKLDPRPPSPAAHHE